MGQMQVIINPKNNPFAIKKIWLAASLLTILGLITGLFLFLRPTDKVSEKKPIRTTSSSFFIPVPIVAYSPGQLPCLQIQVENQTYLATLDLGYRGTCSMKKELVNEIKNKSFIRTRTAYGVLGKEYQKKVYRIPEVKIQRIIFHDLPVEEQSEEFKQDSIIIQDSGDSFSEHLNQVGWEIFQKTNLLLDLGNSKAAFCDGIETLKKQGYVMENFTKAPLLLDRGLVELEVLTENGPLHCSIDTGATYNLINRENSEGKDPKELMMNPENFYTFKSFQINGKDLGPISFKPFPIKIPIHIEVVLGMEFFRTHIVFIDFWNNFIYFAPLNKQDSVNSSVTSK
jgi:hypothetical protein